MLTKINVLHKGHEKQNKTKLTLFYGWTDLPSRVGQSGGFFFFFFFFFISGSKKDPNNIQISRKKI